MFGDTSMLSKIRKNSWNILKHTIFANLKILETDIFDNFRKEGHRNIMKTRQIHLGNLGYGINIYQKTRNGNFVNLRNFETKKPTTKNPINFLRFQVGESRAFP